MRLTIARLGHLGDAIAEGPVFVPGALPGEVVEGDVVDGRMVSPKIVTPSPDRVRAPCKSYKSCGGCLLQHVSDGFVADWKQEIVRSSLAAHRLETEFEPIFTSEPRSRRRAVLSGRRTKKGVLVGFHARASAAIVEPADCHLLHDDIMQGLPALRALTRFGASRKAEVKFTVVRSEGGLDVAATGVRPAEGQMAAELAVLAGDHDLARLTWQDEVIVIRRPPDQMFGAARVTPPPGAFLQATQSGEKMLLSAVSETVSSAARVADLFAGCGTFALPLASRSEVHAVEAEAEMLMALDQGWRRATGLKRVSTEARDLFRRPLLGDELGRFDAVVIDPPRAGADAQFRELAKSGVPVIAAVSCNPVSFARDAAILVKAGYSLDRVQVVDQFRWSAHVELAARFTLT